MLPENDIVACHPLSKRGGEVTSYIVRIGNRRPGSAWDILAAGMLGGKNPTTKKYFSDDNVYVNFQLTKAKGHLSKVVREAKSKKEIKLYSVDQNGRITIKINDSTQWTEVKSSDHLQSLIR